MAKTLIVQLTCDRCKAEKAETVEGAETVTFGFDGYDYSLDLCTPHAADFHDTLQGLIGWSSDRTRVRADRRPRRAEEAPGSPAPAAASRSSADRERLKAIREWARANGYPDLGDRGRIPQAIVAGYDAAH